MLIFSERKRHVCPHSWVDADGKVSACEHNYSDGSGLIRHRSLHHGFEAGDDVAKIQIPTLKGTKFPDSKYARGNKRKAEGDDLLSVPAHRSKRAKRTPAPSSSRRSSKKAASMSTKPAPVQEQQIDWNSLYTLPAASPSEARPSTVSGWDLGLVFPTNSQLPMQSQPASGMSSQDPLADALALLSSAPSQSSNLDSFFDPEPQTAIVNRWSFGPQTTNFDFNFDFDLATAPLSLPARDGIIDPSMLMIPAPTVTPTVEQASLANAGLASSPGFYHPGWGSYSPESSRESTASPDYGMFNAGMPQWIPSPSEPVFNGYYGL